jgi:hypothetical protein
MSSVSESNGRSSGPQAEEGVLANLPRTRPQRSSPRRAAARKASAAADAGKGPQARPVTASGRLPANGAKPSAKPAATKVKSKAKAKAKANTKAKAEAPRAVPRASTRRSAPPVDEGVPRQGFESEMDRATGPVQPPGGAELVSSAAEIFSELARSSLSTGERLLKDALARLPL